MRLIDADELLLHKKDWIPYQITEIDGEKQGLHLDDHIVTFIEDEPEVYLVDEDVDKIITEIADFITERDAEIKYCIDTKDREFLESEIRNWLISQNSKGE